MQEEICKAIKSRHLLRCDYEWQMRMVEPRLLWLSKTGKYQLRCYQLGWWSESGESWRKLFDLDKMSGVQFNFRPFMFGREGYNPDDKSMQEIICRVERDISE